MGPEEGSGDTFNEIFSQLLLLPYFFRMGITFRRGITFQRGIAFRHGTIVRIIYTEKGLKRFFHKERKEQQSDAKRIGEKTNEFDNHAKQTTFCLVGNEAEYEIQYNAANAKPNRQSSSAAISR